MILIIINNSFNSEKTQSFSKQGRHIVIVYRYECVYVYIMYI